MYTPKQKMFETCQTCRSTCVGMPNLHNFRPRKCVPFSYVWDEMSQYMNPTTKRKYKKKLKITNVNVPSKQPNQVPLNRKVDILWNRQSTMTMWMLLQSLTLLVQWVQSPWTIIQQKKEQHWEWWWYSWGRKVLSLDSKSNTTL